MMPFDTLFPALAKDEAHVIQTLDHAKLPNGDYVFREFFCNEPECDCRRVLLRVYYSETKSVVATINYAFEPSKPPFDDEPQIFLDPINPQSDKSEVLVGVFEKLITSDRGYHDRLVRHYALWKSVVDDPAHPDHRKVRSREHGNPAFRPAFPRQAPVGQTGRKIGPNELCPCGSGKKYKRCCRS